MALHVNCQLPHDNSLHFRHGSNYEKDKFEDFDMNGNGDAEEDNAWNFVMTYPEIGEKILEMLQTQ